MLALLDEVEEDCITDGQQRINIMANKATLPASSTFAGGAATGGASPKNTFPPARNIVGTVNKSRNLRGAKSVHHNGAPASIKTNTDPSRTPRS